MLSEILRTIIGRRERVSAPILVHVVMKSQPDVRASVCSTWKVPIHVYLQLSQSPGPSPLCRVC